MSRVEHVERVEPCPFCGKGTTVEHVSWDNCFIVRCLHCGYTSGHIASERGAMIRHNKICRALPKPDPEWKATCAKCHDGEIEPDCEYYGEPNGCNSPIYGEHPISEKSSVVGNSAMMREALKPWIAFAEWLLENAGKDALGKVIAENVLTIRQRRDEACAALAKPPRNCDRFADELDAQIAFLNEVWLISVTKESMLEHDKFENWTDEMKARYAAWLFAAANEKGDDDGSK